MCDVLLFCRSGSITQIDWLLGASVISSGGQGETDVSLTIDSPESNQGGEYHCRAALSDGTTQETSAGYLNLYCK